MNKHNRLVLTAYTVMRHEGGGCSALLAAVVVVVRDVYN
jgi:hypothetical protein